jgi:hypothetical protein
MALKAALTLTDRVFGLDQEISGFPELMRSDGHRGTCSAHAILVSPASFRETFFFRVPQDTVLGSIEAILDHRTTEE